MTSEESIEREGFPDASSGRSDGRALLGRCQATANRLLEVLSEESKVLRKFAPDELLALLPSKQSLVQELEADLKALCGTDIERWKSRANAETLPLRYTLAEIERQNSANQIFVQGSLDFWEGLLAAINPASYGPGSAEPASSGPPRFKGRSFDREV